MEYRFERKNSSLELPKLSEFVFNYQHPEGINVRILPTLHDELAFSHLGFEVLTQHQPDVVLVELPSDLKNILLRGIDRLPIPTVIHDGNLEKKNDLTLIPDKSHAYIIHPGDAIYWTAFLARRDGIPVEFIDKWHKNAYHTWEIPLNYPHLASIGWKRFWTHSKDWIVSHTSDNLNRNRSALMVNRLDMILTESGDTNILIVCGAAHWPAFHKYLISNQFETDDVEFPDEILKQYDLQYNASLFDTYDNQQWNLADIHAHTIHLVTSDLPYYIGKMVEDPANFDYLEYLRDLYFHAEERYAKQFDDQISPASYQRLFQFLRNLGRVQNKVLPDLYNIILAAKGMGDGDYAFEVYRTAISYPFLPSDDEKLDSMLKFTPDENQGEVIRFAFKRRFKRPVLKKIDKDEFDDLDPIPEEEYPGHWQDIWDQYSPYGYVSYPPEDEFIENYLQYLRKRIIEILMEENSHTVEFDSSLEDGIDWRETMRHYHEDKIFVKKHPKNKYKVGALIVQFLEEPFDVSEYSNHSTLFAEHDQESHISVITTEPGDVLIGPGITRVKYAAIISQFPPVGMPYTIPKDNIDLKLRLIWTAMNMSLNKIIGFVAKKPPTAAQRHFASEHGYRLVFLPMGQLTKSSLHRLRTMHLLAHRDLRDRAREYIGF